jgi:hypothetical protein
VAEVRLLEPALPGSCPPKVTDVPRAGDDPPPADVVAGVLVLAAVGATAETGSGWAVDASSTDVQAIVTAAAAVNPTAAHAPAITKNFLRPKAPCPGPAPRLSVPSLVDVGGVIATEPSGDGWPGGGADARSVPQFVQKRELPACAPQR